MNKLRSDKKVVFWLVKQNKKYLNRLLILILLNVIVGGMASYTAIQSKKIIDLIMDSQGVLFKSIYHSIVVFIALIFLTAISNYIIGVLNDSLKFKITVNMQNRLITSILNSEFEKSYVFHTGQFNTYLYSDIPYVTNGFLTIIPHFFNMFTRLITALIFLFFIDKYLALFLIILGCILMIVINIARKYSQKLYRIIQENNEKTRSFIQDSMSNILAIKIFRKKIQIQNNIDKLQKNEYLSNMKRSRLSNLNSLGFFLIYQLGFIGIIVVGGYRIALGTLSLGSLAALIQLSSQVQAPIANIAGLVPIFWGTMASSKRIINISSNEILIPKEISENIKIKKIVLENVNFSYGDKEVLKNIDFTINRGEIIGITGESGSGKTTLLLLIMGLLKSKNVSFIMEDSHLNQVIEKSFDNISFVPQKEFLFQGSIKKNISFFDDVVSESRIEFAAKMSEAEGFINKLPNTYEDIISENGKSLSQGQAQRIAIARAIYADSEIIFLDEATSALDQKTESKILLNLLSLNKTIIMITHRPDTLKYVDKHFHIEEGKLVNVRN